MSVLLTGEGLKRVRGRNSNRQLRGDEIRRASVSSGSAAPVRSHRTQSFVPDIGPIGGCHPRRTTVVLSSFMAFSTTSAKVKFQGRPVARRETATGQPAPLGRRPAHGV